MPIISSMMAGASQKPTEPVTTNLWGWWDATNSYSETSGTPSTPITVDGTNMGSMLDLSGNGRHLYTDPTYKAKFKTSIFGSYPGVDFGNATYDMLTTSSGVKPGDTLSGYIVLIRDSWVQLGAQIGDVNNTLFLADGNTAQGFDGVDDLTTGGLLVDGVVDMTNGTTHLVAFSMAGSGSTTRLKVDDNATTTGTRYSGYDAPGRLQVGRYAGYNCWNGRMAELVIYNVQHDTDAATALLIRQYLDWKYNLELEI